MAIIGNNVQSLLRGLSGFWHRFFADLPDILAAYEGTEMLFGQAYLDLLNNVLATTVANAPVFRKEFYKLITVREDQLSYYDTLNTATSRYVYASTDTYGAAPILQNTVWQPTASLETGIDYDVKNGQLRFLNDPTLPTPPGFAVQNLAVAVGGAFTSPYVADWTATGIAKGDTLYIDPNNGLWSPLTPISTPITSISPQSNAQTLPQAIINVVSTEGFPSAGTFIVTTTQGPATVAYTGTTPTTFTNCTWAGSGTPQLYAGQPVKGRQDAAYALTVILVRPQELIVSANTPLPTFPAGTQPSGFSWQVQRTRANGVTAVIAQESALNRFSGQPSYVTTTNVNSVAFWAVDAMMDNYDLYNNFGFNFGPKRMSSETYRTFIQGIMQLYIFGPAIARLESALNVTAGYPVIATDGEVLQAYDNGTTVSAGDGVLSGTVFNSASLSLLPSDLGGYVYIQTAVNAVNVGAFQIIQVINATTALLSMNVTPINETGLGFAYSRTNQQTVTTNANVYTLPWNIPIDPTIALPASIGTLTFEAFQALSAALVVVDYILDPEWWLNITLPESVLPGMTNAGDRTITPDLVPNVIGPVGDFNIGDGPFEGHHQRFQ